MKARLLAAALVGLAVVPMFVAPALADPVPRVMVVGDSISNGSAGDYTWRYRLWQHEAGAVDFVGPYNGVNYPGIGQTLNYADPNFDREHDALAGRAAFQEKDVIAGKVTTYDPAVLIINLGTNDIGLFNRSAQQARDDLMWLVINASWAPKATPGLKIVLSTLTPTLSGAAYEAKRVELNAKIAQLVVEFQNVGAAVVLADPAVGYAAQADNRDGVHPAISGEYKYAAAYANALAAVGIGAP